MYQQIAIDPSKLAAPVRKFNALVVDHLEKFAQFQIEAARSYSDLSLEQLRAALTVKDAASLKRYVDEQGKVAEALGRKFSADAETLVGLSKDFTVEVQKLAQENVAGLTPSAVAEPAAPTRAPARKSA